MIKIYIPNKYNQGLQEYYNDWKTKKFNLQEIKDYLKDWGLSKNQIDNFFVWFCFGTFYLIGSFDSALNEYQRRYNNDIHWVDIKEGKKHLINMFEEEYIYQIKSLEDYTILGKYEKD